MIEFGVLGPLMVSRSGQRQPLPRAAVRRLLGLLLARCGTPVTTDVLIDELWPGRAVSDVRAVLHVTVSRLRQLLGENDRLETHPRAYAIHPRPDEFDVWTFQHLVTESEGARKRADLTAARTAIGAALDTWRGQAYLDVRDVPSIAIEADRLDELRMYAYEEAFDIDLDGGEHAKIVAELSAMATAHPYRERICGLHMLALYRCGRQSEALSAYRRTYKLLTDDVGVEPGPELQRLHQAMLTGDPGLDLAVGQRIEVQQPRPSLLPRATAHFSGRREQLDALDRISDGGGTASPVAILTTLTGSAGVGKTALAVQWARTVTTRFPDGQLYINLQGYGVGEPVSPFSALSHLLRELGVSREQMPHDEQSAMARYRAILAESRALVILDNAVSVAQVRPLLASGSGCMSVVTSRDRLAGLVAMDGAHRVPLDMLTLDEAITLLRSILGAARVDREPEATAGLIGLCGRLPLALRIAAAALTEQPSRSVAEQVALFATTERLPLLVVEGDPDNSVRTALSYSYRDLNTDTQRLFRLLGTAPGRTIGVAAAAALSSQTVETVAEQLDRLCAVHLLDEPATGRYRLHDLIRDYARELARFEDSEEALQEALDRLLSWYVAHAHNADTYLRADPSTRDYIDASIEVPAFDDAAGALAWLDHEGSNLEAVIRDMETVQPRRSWQLTAILYQWHQRHGDVHAWIDTAATGVRASEAIGDLTGSAYCHSSLAVAWFHAGQPAESVPHFERSLQLRRAVGDPGAIVSGLLNIAGVLGELGRSVEALAHIEEALAIIGREPGLDYYRMTVLINAGWAYKRSGQAEKALGTMRRAAAVAMESGDDISIASATSNLGGHLLDMGQYDDAIDVLRQSLGSGIRASHHRYQRNALLNLGYAELGVGNVAAAREYLVDAEGVDTEDGVHSVDELRQKIEDASR